MLFSGKAALPRMPTLAIILAFSGSPISKFKSVYIQAGVYNRHGILPSGILKHESGLPTLHLNRKQGSLVNCCALQPQRNRTIKRRFHHYTKFKFAALSHQVSAAEFPHLPLPDVAKTMERYLDAVAAVVPAEDHARARLQVVMRY